MAYKLTEEDVLDMRRLRRVGLTLQQIADKYYMSRSLVSRVVREDPVYWKNVREEERWATLPVSSAVD